MPNDLVACPTCGGFGKVSKLSAREQAVLLQIAEGKCAKDIAAALDIAVKTVEVHKYNLMRKTGTHSVLEVMRYAFENGYASIPPKAG